MKEELEELLQEAYNLDLDQLLTLGMVRIMKLKFEALEQEILKEMEKSCSRSPD